MGVGAAIAKGNHGENGKIALFVIKVKHKNTQSISSGEQGELTEWG
jgi:hypothetical protein